MARGRHVSFNPNKADVIEVKGSPFDQDPGEVRTARISSVFREPVTVVHNTIGPAKSLREHILRMSLFPNIFNRDTVRMSD